MKTLSMMTSYTTYSYVVFDSEDSNKIQLFLLTDTFLLWRQASVIPITLSDLQAEYFPLRN